MLTVGEILQTERIKQELTIKGIEKKIKVREKFLKAIEANDWRVFSSKIYIAGIIKNYSLVLGLNPDKMLAFFRRDYARKEEVSFKKRIASKHLTPQSRRYFIFITAIISLLFSLYFSYQLFRFLSPPTVDILSPTVNSFKRKDRVKIIGRTEKEAVITIFGDRVYQNKDGIFFYDFPLKSGKNTLIINIIGANGKETIIKKEFFLSP